MTDLPPEAVEAAARAWLTETGQPDLLDTVDLAIASTALAAALPHIEKAIRADQNERIAQAIESYMARSAFALSGSAFRFAARIARGASTDTEQANG